MGYHGIYMTIHCTSMVCTKIIHGTSMVCHSNT
nr:MAG TPA: hypothetical protein [Caudoviricetes sp.]